MNRRKNMPLTVAQALHNAAERTVDAADVAALRRSVEAALSAKSITPDEHRALLAELKRGA